MDSGCMGVLQTSPLPCILARQYFLLCSDGCAYEWMASWQHSRIADCCGSFRGSPSFSTQRVAQRVKGQCGLTGGGLSSSTQGAEQMGVRKV